MTNMAPSQQSLQMADIQGHYVWMKMETVSLQCVFLSDI